MKITTKSPASRCVSDDPALATPDRIDPELLESQSVAWLRYLLRSPWLIPSPELVTNSRMVSYCDSVRSRRDG